MLTRPTISLLGLLTERATELARSSTLNIEILTDIGIKDVSWGRHNQVVITPTKFELKTDFAFPNSLKFDQNTPARPTSSICLTSEATKRPYLIFGNQVFNFEKSNLITMI